MGDNLANMVSTISAVLFIASTAVNIYVTMRITKLENNLKDDFNEKLKEGTKNLIHQTDMDREIRHLKELIQSRIDYLDRRINGGVK